MYFKPKIQSSEVWLNHRRFTFFLLCTVTFTIGTGHCWTYHFSTEDMMYEQAQTFCKSKYTDLVAIQNKKEIEYLDENIPRHNKYYWIGIRKIDGVWTWVGTNKSLTKEAENWGNGEPNNKKNNEDCVEIYIKRQIDSGKWNDDSCTKGKRALCYTASCNSSSCSGHGDCIEIINNYRCACDPGFYGEFCQYAVKCEFLTPLQNGVFSCIHPWGNYSFGSTCEFLCSEGWNLKGPNTTKCGSTGQWTENVPECEAVQCPHLSSKPLQRMNCSHPWGNFSYQSFCHFECFDGFFHDEVDKIECFSTGKWSDAPPQCSAVKCEFLTPPRNGLFSCIHPWGNYSFGSTCGFSCLEGWNLKGPTMTKCGSTGQWTENVPECKEQSRLQYSQTDHQKPVIILGLATISSALILALALWLINRKLRKDKKNNSSAL
ncbi:L-selectin [Hyperolius riggenbachi]|uniref:L-selectin n=1 Tax=Hyperolius riggenbachi TaxID=752182 RepID=UPI0035A394B6